MFNFLYRKWRVGKIIRSYEDEALGHEVQASEIFLDIRNAKGLITAEQEDIKANEDDIKQDEFDIEKIKKASDDELFAMWDEAQLENGRQPSELEGLRPALDELRKESNENIQQLQQEIKNLKAANDQARKNITEREMELRGVKDQAGKIIRQGHNTKYQGHIAAAQKSRIHADELKKFLKKSHKNKIKLADE